MGRAIVNSIRVTALQHDWKSTDIWPAAAGNRKESQNWYGRSIDEINPNEPGWGARLGPRIYSTIRRTKKIRKTLMDADDGGQRSGRWLVLVIFSVHGTKRHNAPQLICWTSPRATVNIIAHNNNHHSVAAVVPCVRDGRDVIIRYTAPKKLGLWISVCWLSRDCP